MKCPRCLIEDLADDKALNALSRHADVYICNPCGMDESVRDFAPLLPVFNQSQWPVFTRYSFPDLG